MECTQLIPFLKGPGKSRQDKKDFQGSGFYTPKLLILSLATKANVALTTEQYAINL
jgi:hypothetical protein